MTGTDAPTNDESDIGTGVLAFELEIRETIEACMDPDNWGNLADISAAENIIALPSMVAAGAALATMAPGGDNDDSAAQEGTRAWRDLPEAIQAWALSCMQ